MWLEIYIPINQETQKFVIIGLANYNMPRHEKHAKQFERENKRTARYLHKLRNKTKVQPCAIQNYQQEVKQ